MRRRKMLLTILGLVALSGCFLKAPNVTELVKAQEAYYGDLSSLLDQQRATLSDALAAQLDADRARQRELLLWERDLSKADVLLQTPQQASGARKLLLMETAEVDLITAEEYRSLERIDQDRKDAILRLYDALGTAVEALRKNTKVISEYLGSDDATLALRSIDTEAIAYAVTRIREAAKDVESTEERSQEERAKAAERLDKRLEQAREAILKGLR